VKSSTVFCPGQILDQSRSAIKILWIVLFVALFGTKSLAQKWVNPCASTNSEQKKMIQENADSTEVCSFLDRTYAEVDNRCGLVFTRFWPPTRWFHSEHPYDVVPNEVLQNLPREAFVTSTEDPWIELSIPSLARLLTTGIYSDKAPMKDDWIKAVQMPFKQPSALHFNPFTDPQILRDDGDGVSVHKVTCTNALTATESGNLKLAVATVSEKFSAQENSSDNIELVYGTFVSPLSHLGSIHSASYLLETLDLYRQYFALNGNQKPTQKIWYLGGVEGIAVYNTVKKQLATDKSATGSADYEAPLGGINGSANDDLTFGENTSANLFHTLVRHPVWVQLPSFDETLNGLKSLGSNLIAANNQYRKAPLFDAPSKTVTASFVMEELPTSLCSVSAWGLVAPSPADLTLSARFLSSAQQTKAAPVSSPITHPPSVCIWTVATSTPPPPGTHLKGTLVPMVDASHTINTINFDYPYQLAVPSIKLMTPTAAATGTSVEFVYQIPNPSLLQAGTDPNLDVPQTLTCGNTTISDFKGTAVSSSTYTPPGQGSTAISGTFYHVRYQWSSPATNNACTPSGSLLVVTQNGAPATLILPQQ